MCSTFSQWCALERSVIAILGLENMLPGIETTVLSSRNWSAAVMDEEGQSRCGRFTPSNVQYSDLNSLTSSTSESAEQQHLNIIDQEEDSLPSLSFHDAYGNLIDGDEYNRLADLELDHAASVTLHLLYPNLYEEPVETRDRVVDLLIRVDKGCYGERMARIYKEGCCSI